MKRQWIPFLFLILISLFLVFLTESLLKTPELINNFLQTEYSKQEIEEIYKVSKNWSFLKYVASFLLIIIKIALVILVISVGLFFFNYKISLGKLFKIVSIAEFLFLIVPFIKIIWLIFVLKDYELLDIQYFYPLSALNIVGYEGLDPWFIYPLQVLNLFELAYWFILAYLLGKELNISMDKGFKIVASSYGPALAIWVVAVMFFTLNYS